MTGKYRYPMLVTCLNNEIIRLDTSAENKTRDIIGKELIKYLLSLISGMLISDISILYISTYLNTICIKVFKKSELVPWHSALDEADKK